MIKLFIIFFLLILQIYFKYPNLKKKLVLLKIYIFKKLHFYTLIEIDTSASNSNRGPGNFIKGIMETLPFTWKNCSFISSSFINKHLQPDLYFIPYPKIKEKQFQKLVKEGIANKLILGPIFVPKKWNNFPNSKVWKEKRFSYILEQTKGIAVHSTRVRDYLAKKSNTVKNIKKFFIIRPCSNLKPNHIKSFKDREIDILFFEKYADLNRRQQGLKLLNLLKNTSKTVASIKYGSYNKTMMKEMASNSRFIIYFSFFDTGAIGLKEIQNYGVITFTHQKEFVLDKESSFYIPELASTNKIEISFNKIMNIIEKVSKMNIKTELIARKNQIINNCENSLIDLCEGLF